MAAPSSNSTWTGSEPCREAWILTPAFSGEVMDYPVKAWGLSAIERLERGLQRAGVAHTRVFPPDQALPDPADHSYLLLRADYFYDERLIQGLVGGGERILVCPDTEKDGADRTAGQPVAARINTSAGDSKLHTAAELLRGDALAPARAALDTVPSVSSLAVAPAYNPALRKHDPPFLYPARRETVRQTENRIFASSYKGITDLVTKWVFPLPARELTRLLARRGVRPNSVTAISYLLTGLAGWCFLGGHFGVGLLAAWGMTFLDTVDGKLARVTLTSSPLGNVLDHGLDLVHPPFWWAAWAFGLSLGEAGLGPYYWPMWIIVGGYVVGRILEGIFLLAFKQEIFCWRPFDAFFRSIIARRNPNLLLLSAGTVAGRPDLGFLAVATWTCICIAVHVVRIAQAFAVRAHGIAIEPWNGPAAAATHSAETRE